MVSRSSNDGKAWRCRCGTVNLPTQHRIFKLPAFHCSNCGRKLALDFKFCLGDIEIGGKSLLGEVRDQGKDPYCVAFAYAKAAEVMERGMSISNGTDPDLVIPINPCRLEKRFVEKYPDVSLDGALTRSLGVHKVLHMGLILRSEGIRRFDVGSTTKPEEQINNDEPYKIADVSTISCDSFEEICKTLAEGTPLVATYLAGKRRSHLPYCKIYKSPSKAAIKAKGAKEIGHAVVLVGAGMKRGKKYFYILNSWGKKFCPRKNKKGEIVSGGIGKLRAEDLTKNLIKLCPQAGGERRLHDQPEFKISRINYLLMTGKEKHCSTQRLKRLREEATSKYVPAVIFDDGIFRDDEGGSQVCPSISENSYITSSDCVKAYSDPNNTARSAEAGQGHPRVRLPHEVLQAPSQPVRDMDRHCFLPGGNPRFDGNRGGDFRNNWQGQGNRNWVPHGHDERDPRNQPWQNLQGPQDDQREGSGTNQKVESTKVEASVNNSTQTAVKYTQSNVDGGVGTQNIQQELTDRPQFCQRCGRVGHNPNACPNPVVCIRCKNEGHVARVCQNKMPWEFIAPFYGLSAYGQGFHVIHSAKTEECVKDMSSIAGEVTARQIEHEFTVKAGKSSN